MRCSEDDVFPSFAYQGYGAGKFVVDVTRHRGEKNGRNYLGGYVVDFEGCNSLISGQRFAGTDCET